MMTQVEEVSQKIEQQKPLLNQLTTAISQVIVGQQDMIRKLLIGLLADGHILVEGVPGLAKTTAIKALSDAVAGVFKRIQFTPDLLPADLTGTQIYSPKDGTFTVKKGPLFANFVLADEINRAPAKVQSALLEAMQEKQVTIGDETFSLPTPFIVLATQNPVEQEGTYPLPEAQVDRFMLKVQVTYPNKEDEIEVMKRMASRKSQKIEPVITIDNILACRKLVSEVFVDNKLYDYVANLVFATRDPELVGLKDLKRYIEYGASPRASIFMIQAAQAYAFLQGRGYVTPQDIKMIGADILRHRILVSYEADAQNLTSDDIVVQIFDKVDVP